MEGRHGVLDFYAKLSLLLLIVSSAESTISPGDKKDSSRQLKIKTGPQNETIFERGLVMVEPLARDITIHNAAYYHDTALRHFNGTVLGYVTAWNSYGYDIAKRFAKKFDIISPVWFQINKNQEHYEIAGSHDIDAGWIKDVRRKGSSTIKIFPRMIFEKFTERDFSRLLSYETERNKLNAVIGNACKINGFNGIVLEIWSQLASRVDDQFLYTFVLEMAKSLQRDNLRLILVIPPYRPEMPSLFGEKQLEQLYKHVYAFSLMTYDFSNVQRPGANAPLYWMRSTVEHLVPATANDATAKRSKILLGLNMYGNDYTPEGGGPIIGKQYLELVKNVKKKLTYDERDVENFFETKTNSGRHYVFYPTLHSIHMRVKLAQELGVGISIWELGQGLDYFYDLL